MHRPTFSVFLLAASVVMPAVHASTCTTQAAMTEPIRQAITASATELAGYVASSSTDKIRARTIPQFATDNFGGIQNNISLAASQIQPGPIQVDSVWLLDATDLKSGADGAMQDGQFFCLLRGASSQVTFLIPSLPPGRYALAILATSGAKPWQLPFLLQEIAGRWQLAGFFPHPLTRNGHDGLWYWRSAREDAEKKQPWNAWIFYQQALALLRPVPFFTSTHLEKLQDEATKAAPSALSQGISKEQPLVLRMADGKDLYLTGLSTDDSPDGTSLDVAIHIRAEAIEDAAQARARNRAAAAAFVKAYPEVRARFHGIWTYAETEGRPPFPSEEPLAGLQ